VTGDLPQQVARCENQYTYDKLLKAISIFRADTGAQPLSELHLDY
jgi:hypothetical protein